MHCGWVWGQRVWRGASAQQHTSQGSRGLRPGLLPRLGGRVGLLGEEGLPVTAVMLLSTQQGERRRRQLALMPVVTLVVVMVLLVEWGRQWVCWGTWSVWQGGRLLPAFWRGAPRCLTLCLGLVEVVHSW